DLGDNDMNITDKNELPKAEREARGRPQKEVIRSQTVIRAVADFLLLGNEVYRLAEPDRVLTVKKIHWNSQTSDLEDDQGRVYRDVSWDDIEFQHPEDYHLAGDE